MRVFTTLCKDNETGHAMVLEDCSYNVALDWLQKKQRSVGRDVFRIDNTDTWHYTIYTGMPKDGYDVNGQPDRFYTDTIKYYYDELRGYLLSE